MEVSERVRKARDNRKMMKQLQVQSQLQRVKDKKELMDEVKKYRKGIRKDLDFLEPGGNKKKGQPQKQVGQNQRNTKSAEKRKFKDSKYGHGGKKSGSKKNTKDSAADVSGYRPPKKPVGKNQQRPGKNKRKHIKSKRRK